MVSTTNFSPFNQWFIAFLIKMRRLKAPSYSIRRCFSQRFRFSYINQTPTPTTTRIREKFCIETMIFNSFSFGSDLPMHTLINCAKIQQNHPKAKKSLTMNYKCTRENCVCIHTDFFLSIYQYLFSAAFSCNEIRSRCVICAFFDSALLWLA